MKIPEKWCIKLKDKNIERVVGKWFNENVEIQCEYDTGWFGWLLHYPKYLQGTCTAMTPHPGYTEITYDQFKKYVFNQQEENYSYLTKILEKWNIK